MEIRVLRYFVETARAGSMTRAAERLHVTQPTLSRQLKSLEEELGQELFTRSNYSINLTPEGQLLYERASDILAMTDRTLAEFEDLKGFGGGDVSIGCAESEGIRCIAQAARRLREQYPGFRIHLYSGNAGSVTERLQKGLLDFAVIVQQYDTTVYRGLTLPYRDRWGLLMKKESPLSALSEIPYDTLLELPLIYSGEHFSREMPEWFLSHEDDLNLVATYNLAYNASLLVREGLGYALVFDHLIDTSETSPLCFRPLVPEITAPMHLIWGRKQTLSRAAALFLEQLQQACMQ